MKIPLWFATIISRKQRRYNRYVSYWNSRANDIVQMIRADTRDPIQVEMSWLHLIDQEICAWNMQGYVDNFDWLAKRRGFSVEQQRLMHEIIKVMGLKYRDT